MKERVLQLVVVLTSLLFGLILFEVAARLFLKPCDGCYALFFGVKLPPIQVLTEGAVPPVDPAAVWLPTDGKNRNPLNLTMADIFGTKREDLKIGYTEQENFVSARGWWISNNIGARSRMATLPAVPKGKQRILVFGESYGQASRVAQDQTWFAQLQTRLPRQEIVNLAVDGYGMGQAYLRYLEISPRLAWSTVVFMFVPEADLWRDINTQRFVGEGWGSYTIMPRFILEAGNLKLIPGPYAKGSDIYRHDLPELTPRVREHLRVYDRFYSPLIYESPPLVGNLISYKLVAQYLGQRRWWQTYEAAKADPQGEAMRVVRQIFSAIARDAASSGRKFRLVLLPDPDLVVEVRKHPESSLAEIWQRRVRVLTEDGLPVVDLLPEMKSLSSDQLDRGYDGTHYGPKANAAIAQAMAGKFND